MKSTVAYALLAVVMALVIFQAVAPMANGISAVMHKINRTLRTSPRN